MYIFETDHVPYYSFNFKLLSWNIVTWFYNMMLCANFVTHTKDLIL